MRRFLILLIAMALLTGSASALTMEIVVIPTVGDALGVDIVGYVYHATPEDYPQEKEALLKQTDGRQVIVMSTSWFSRWLYIPQDGPDAEEYYGKAVRFTLDETSFDESISPADDISSLPDVLQPASIEIIGSEMYGTLVEICEDYLVISPYKDNAYGNEHEDEIRLAINEDSIGYIAVDDVVKMAKGRHITALYTPDSSCEILFDEETLTVLVMWGACG